MTGFRIDENEHRPYVGPMGKAKKKAAKPKIGRPPKDVIRELISMRVTPEEKAAFEEYAERQGLPMTTWLRLAGRRAAGMEGG